MGYYITYDSITAFVPADVHSSTAHNSRHNNLVGNDGQLDAALYAANNTITSLQSQINSLAAAITALPPARIITTALPSRGGMVGEKEYTYTYTGSYVPLFITIAVFLNGSSNAVVISQYRWLNSGGAAMTPYTTFVALNPAAGGDGGAALNDTFNATIPFIVGAKSIQMSDTFYPNREFFQPLTITEHQIPRWGAWGY